jgi:ssDNA-binding Zn-finger/Zn-ribbon topoisomerase 1
MTMAGEMVGTVECAECGAESPVRLNKNKKKFYLCPSCGLIYPNTKEGQERLEKRLRLVGALKPAPAPEPTPTPQPEPAPKPAPEPEPALRKSSILDMLP